MSEDTGFRSERLSGRLYRIIDSMDVCCYLAVGDKSACLMDTCFGVGDLSGFVKTLTDKPVFVVLSHGHVDHMGGAGQFEHVYMNTADSEIFHQHGSLEFRVNMLKNHFGKQLDESAFAPDFTGQLCDIKDGDAFDLGGVTVKMLAVKGHTPGSMCPLIVEERTLIVGDACDDNVLLFEKYSSSVADYKKSLQALIAREGEYDTVLGNHEGFTFDKQLTANVLECCNMILQGRDARWDYHFDGRDLLSCYPLKNGLRSDGKHGNIIYTVDKL